jgi:hypothetical protein
MKKKTKRDLRLFLVMIAALLQVMNACRRVMFALRASDVFALTGKSFGSFSP